MKNMLLSFDKALMLASLALAVSLTGCSGLKNSMRLGSKDSALNPVTKLKAKKEVERPVGEPATIVATWKGSTYEQAGAPSVNGFGGRLFFYDQDNNAVEADGDLYIYGFDNTKPRSDDELDNEKADKKFVFRSSEFQTHKSESGFGVSYSVWCPWEKVGGYRKTITLIPIFKTADGRILTGGHSINILRGAAPEHQMSENKPYKVLGSSPAVLSQANFQSTPNSQPNIAQASFDGNERPREGIKTSTINLTPNMAHRVAMQNTRVEKQPTVGLTVGPQSGHRDIRKQIKERALKTDPLASVSEADPVPQRRAFGAPGSFN